MNTFLARPLFDPGSEELRYLPECPRLLRNGLLGWVAIQHGEASTAGSFNTLNLETLQNTTHELPGRPGFFAETDTPGVIMVGLERRLVLYDISQRKVIETGITVTSDPRVAINDGSAVPDGLLFGTKHLGFKEEVAHVYSFNARTKELREVRDRRICSNGIVITSSGVIAYIDSPFKTIVGLADDHIIADFRHQAAYPDGMRLTPDKRSLIVAFYNPTAMDSGVARQVNATTGELEAEWQLPGSPRVTCPEFVRYNGQVCLLFTTAVEGMPADQRKTAPHAGHIFIAECGFDTLPDPPPLVPAF